MMSLRFAGEQAFTQNALGLFQSTAFREVGVLRHQHIADVIRMIRKKHLPIEDPEGDEISVAGCQVLEEREGIPAKSHECRIDRTAGTWRVEGWQVFIYPL